MTSETSTTKKRQGFLPLGAIPALLILIVLSSGVLVGAELGRRGTRCPAPGG